MLPASAETLLDKMQELNRAKHMTSRVGEKTDIILHLKIPSCTLHCHHHLSNIYITLPGMYHALPSHHTPAKQVVCPFLFFAAPTVLKRTIQHHWHHGCTNYSITIQVYQNPVLGWFNVDAMHASVGCWLVGGGVHTLNILPGELSATSIICFMLCRTGEVFVVTVRVDGGSPCVNVQGVTYSDSINHCNT